MTISGMSSTPSMTLISVSRSCGRQGAKPTPQLPISTVVTPWPDDGREAVVPGHLAVIVGVDVDEARRDRQALGVDLLAPGAGDAADRGDAAVLHATSASRGSPPVPSSTVPLRTTKSTGLSWRPPDDYFFMTVASPSNDTCAATIRQPSGVRIQVWLWRPFRVARDGGTRSSPCRNHGRR